MKDFFEIFKQTLSSALTKYYRNYCKLPSNLMSLEIREKYLNDSKNNPEIPNESIIETQKIIIYLNEYEKHKAQEFFGKTYEELQKIDGDKNRKISSKFYFYE